jgi:hypothetical protein
MTAASKSSESIPKDNELVHNTGYYNQDELLTDELSSYNDDNIPDTWNVATTTHTHAALLHDETSNTTLDIQNNHKHTEKLCRLLQHFEECRCVFSFSWKGGEVEH